MKMKRCLLFVIFLGALIAAALLLPAIDGRRSHRHAVHFRAENAPPRSISFVVGTNVTTTQSNRGE